MACRYSSRSSRRTAAAELPPTLNCRSQTKRRSASRSAAPLRRFDERVGAERSMVETAGRMVLVLRQRSTRRRARSSFDRASSASPASHALSARAPAGEVPVAVDPAQDRQVFVARLLAGGVGEQVVGIESELPGQEAQHFARDELSRGQEPPGMPQSAKLQVEAEPVVRPATMVDVLEVVLGQRWGRGEGDPTLPAGKRPGRHWRRHRGIRRDSLRQLRNPPVPCLRSERSSCDLSQSPGTRVSVQCSIRDARHRADHAVDAGSGGGRVRSDRALVGFADPSPLARSRPMRVTVPRAFALRAARPC